jgi:hypothetical protein
MKKKNDPYEISNTQIKGLGPQDDFLWSSKQVGRPSYYVRFHQPVPPAEDKEPVSEFRLESKQSKYVVDSILWTIHGVIVKAFGETQIIPLANVIYCRWMTEL